MTSSPIYDVIIIGAGVSGLKAAQTIGESGLSYHIIEARGRPGGRVWTETNLFPVPIDYGAHWIHTFWYNPLIKLAHKHGIELYPNDYQRAGFYKDGNRISKEIVKKARIKFNYVITEILHREWPEQTNIEEGMNQILEELSSFNDSPIIRALVNSFMYLLVADNSGVELTRANLNLWKVEELDFDVHGGDQLPEGGMWSLFRKEFEAILPKVTFDCPVELIDYTKPTLSVHTSCGTFLGRKVIVTIPIPVLQSNTVHFVPQLPVSYKEAIHSFEVGLLNCITLQFEHTFWNEDDEFLYYLPDHPKKDPTKILFFSTFHHTHPGLLIAWTCGHQAEKWENLSDQEQLRRVISTLEKMFPKIPKIEKFAISRWFSDRFSRGSYVSVTSVKALEKQKILSEPLEERVFFAGEGVSENYGSVSGAYLSGKEQAEKVIALFRKYGPKL